MPGRLPATLSARITSIDALRGLTVAFMILVNDPGDWAHVYAPLEHAPWNGFTPTDLVFPMFLFLVGCSIVFAVQSRLARGVARRVIALQMLRRAVYIFLIKMFLTAFPYFHMTHLRIFGVLTRIALCYLVAGLLFLWTQDWRRLAAIAGALLVGYWVLMRVVPVPGFGVPTHGFPILDPERNLAAWVDRGFNAWCQRWLHTGVLYEGTRDPEGLLSTLPSVATTLLGILAALWLRRSERPHPEGTRRVLLVAGILSLTVARVWNSWFPINKNLWTSTFVLYAGGWSLIALALAYWLLDSDRVHERSRLARGLLWPLLVFGSNAITAFAVSNLIVEVMLWWKVAQSGGRPVSALRWIYVHGFAAGGSTNNTSLAFAVAFVCVCFLPNWLLWRRKIFLRV